MIFCRVHSGDGLGAEVYTEMLQKNMTPYITTNVSSKARFNFFHCTKKKKINKKKRKRKKKERKKNKVLASHLLVYDLFRKSCSTILKTAI